MRKKYGDEPKERRVIGLIYHLHYDLNFSYQEIVNILDNLNIKTRKGKNFQKSRIQLIIDNTDYQNVNFLRQETLERMIKLKAIKNNGLNIEKPKEAFQI